MKDFHLSWQHEGEAAGHTALCQPADQNEAGVQFAFSFLPLQRLENSWKPPGQLVSHEKQRTRDSVSEKTEGKDWHLSLSSGPYIRHAMQAPALMPAHTSHTHRGGGETHTEREISKFSSFITSLGQKEAVVFQVTTKTTPLSYKHSFSLILFFIF